MTQTPTTTEELKHLASSENDNELTRRLARECLASREAKPVGFDVLADAVKEVTGGIRMEFTPGTYKGHQSVPFMNFTSLSRIVEMFRTTPPAPAVPDEITAPLGAIANGYQLSIAQAEGYRWGWNACRAAMLAQPVSSGYKLPADWRLDESTGAKILMYKDCSVIEDQQAEYVLSLIQAAAPEGGN